MKILNLYAGIGGNRKLWGDEHDITAVEWNEETAKVYTDYFPNDKMVVGDAHQYLLDHYKEFDFIWSSPPCPTHSNIRVAGVKRGYNKAVYPDMKLYQEIIFLDKHIDDRNCKWVIENVNPYYEPLIEPSKKIDRHLYWSNFRIGNLTLDREIRINDVSASDVVYDFDLSATGIKNKKKALRNMVNPKIGLHILNAAQNIITKSNTEQGVLF